ncbi:MAG: hypothetical protein V4671_29250, partial [Armatimonadota bacterium]
MIEQHRTDTAPNGHFTPSAKLVVTPALRTSGLLRALPDRETKSLLLMLTFLTPNGRVSPTVAQLAEALGLPEAVVRSRMGRLAAFRWQGERIVRHAYLESGAGAYRVTEAIVSEIAVPEPDAPPPKAGVYASRETVIEHSRQAYGRPRAEVEGSIALRIGN